MSEISATFSWPPLYTIKKHRLAKHVKLRAKDNLCVEITIPTRFNLKHIPAILEENKTWIIKHLAQSHVIRNDVLPHQIKLMAMNQTWNIYYEECQSSPEMIIKPNLEIVFVGKKLDIKIYKKNLILWVKRQAKKHLLAELTRLSKIMSMNFDTLTIRDQKSRWGSCSSTKSISLNYKLILLPAHLLQHVIIHELCHTVHLNHSEKFWNKVAEFDINWREHRRELRKADKYMPEWL